MSEKTKAEQLAENVTNFVNSYGHDSEGFITAFLKQHRTLQQSAFRMFLELIERMGEETELNRFTDGRNEQSFTVARKLLAGFKSEVIKEQLESGQSQEKAEEFANSKYCKPSKFLSFI